MPVGTLISLTFRRRSGHAVLMAFDKICFHLVLPDRERVVFQLTLYAWHTHAHQKNQNSFGTRQVSTATPLHEQRNKRMVTD